MGVQCKLLGHVRDSTEFEERQETRPNGTVLICREYQVCRRCGDREEMYRNERVLTPQAAEADTRTAATTEGVGASGQPDTATAAAEEPDTTDSDSRDVAAVPASEFGTEGEKRGDSPGSEGADAGGASAAGCRDREAADSTGRDQVTDDAVILSDSSADAGRPTADTPTRVRADGTGPPLSAPGTDGAVILSASSTDANPSRRKKNGRPESTAKRRDSSQGTGGGSPPTSSFGAGRGTDGRLNCTSCGREWDRDATSLRAGDLCPGCREAYVEEA